MPVLTTIYKIKKGSLLSEKVFTLKKAREIRKKLEGQNKNVKVEIIPYKTNVQIIDMEPSGEISFFKEWNENDK